MESPRYIEVLASAARTAAVTSDRYPSYGCRGLHLVIDVTAVTDTPSLTVTIQGYDELSGKYYSLLVGTAITATGTTVLKVYPGIATLAGGAASDVLPNSWRVSIAVGDSDSATYSVAAHLIP